MLPEIETQRAAPLLAAAIEMFARAADQLTVRQGHLFARVNPPEGLEQGERYEVDLEQRSFQVFWGGGKVSDGEAAVFGTHDPADGSWLWAWNNPSLTPGSFEDLRAMLEAAGLGALAGVPRFGCGAEVMQDLLASVLIRTVWDGVYPARKGDTQVMLAVRLTEHLGQPVKGLSWCSFCGRSRFEVKTLITGGNAAVCDGCVADFDDVLSELFVEPGADASAYLAPMMPPCALCGERRPRVFGRYAAMCSGCHGTCRQVLAGQ